MSREEKEIKIKLPKKRFEELILLVSQTADFKGEKNQKDEYFDTEKFYITNLNRGLRIRWDNLLPKVVEFKSLFYNINSKNNKNPWFIEEIAMSIPLAKKDISKLTDVLRRLNLKGMEYVYSSPLMYSEIVNYLNSFDLKPKIVVDKTRMEYMNGDTMYVFDHIKGLGYFLEVESQDPVKTLNELSITAFTSYREGYNDMIANGSLFYLSNEEKQKRFKEDPKWNILPSEKNLVENLLGGSPIDV